MEIRTYNKKTLMEFIESDEFRNLTHIPISRLRAISQVYNPRAEESDVLLAVSFEENRITGYLGVLPDLIYIKSTVRKAGWLSCYWVDEPYRSSMVSGSLFMEIMDAWNRNIMITNFVPSLLPLYQRTGIFQKEIILKGIRGYMRLNLGEILPFKNELFRKLKPLLQFTDFIFNTAGDLRFYFGSRKYNRLHYEYRDKIDTDLFQFVEQYSGTNLCRRGPQELNWILTFPWISENDPAGENKKYYFSLWSRRFFYRIVTLLNQSQKITGFFIICVRDNNMTIPYVFSEDYRMVTGIIVRHMLEFNCSMLTVFHEGLTASLKQIRRPFLFKKTIQKPYLVSKNLGPVNPGFQDGDGDCAFY